MAPCSFVLVSTERTFGLLKHNIRGRITSGSSGIGAGLTTVRHYCGMKRFIERVDTKLLSPFLSIVI
jgi:hypothetical protein